MALDPSLRDSAPEQLFLALHALSPSEPLNAAWRPELSVCTPGFDLVRCFIARANRDGFRPRSFIEKLKGLPK